MIQSFKKFDLIPTTDFKNEYKDSISFPQLMKSIDCDWIYSPGYGNPDINTYESDDEDTSEYKNQQFETYYFATHLGGFLPDQQFKFFLFINAEKVKEFEDFNPWLSLTTVDGNSITCCTNRGHAFAYRLFPFCTSFTSDFSKLIETEEIVKDLIAESSEENRKKIEGKKWVLYELNFVNFVQDDMTAFCLFDLDLDKHLINTDLNKVNFLKELCESGDIFTVSRQVEPSYGVIDPLKIENLELRAKHAEKLLENPKEWAMPDNDVPFPLEKLYSETHILGEYSFKMSYYLYDSREAAYRCFYLIIDDFKGNTSYFFL